MLRDGPVLVVCEVKTRSSTAYGTPHEAITPAKLARLRRLAAQWLATHAPRVTDVRIDLVAIVRPTSGPTTLEHVRGVG
ncbi:MAG: YraN family protein [Nocardioides sp.]